MQSKPCLQHRRGSVWLGGIVASSDGSAPEQSLFGPQPITRQVLEQEHILVNKKLAVVLKKLNASNHYDRKRVVGVCFREFSPKLDHLYDKLWNKKPL